MEKERLAPGKKKNTGTNGQAHDDRGAHRGSQVSLQGPSLRGAWAKLVRADMQDATPILPRKAR